MEFVRIAFLFILKLLRTDPVFRAALLEHCPSLQNVAYMDKLTPEIGRAITVSVMTEFPGYMEWLQDYVKDPKYDQMKANYWELYLQQVHNPNSPTGKMRLTAMLSAGPPLWKELHTFAANWNEDVKGATTFFNRFYNKIPCGTCKSGWKTIITDTPPVITTRDELFEWTVMAHNKVNEKLGKLQFSVEAAKALYFNTQVSQS